MDIRQVFQARDPRGTGDPPGADVEVPGREVLTQRQHGECRRRLPRDPGGHVHAHAQALPGGRLLRRERRGDFQKNMLERREPRPALPDARGVDRPHHLHRPVGQGQPQERLQGVAAHGQSPRPNMAHRRAGRAGHLPGDDEKHPGVVPRKPQPPHNAHRDGKEAAAPGLQDHIRPVPGGHGVDMPPGMGHPEHGRQVYGHRIHPRSPLHVRQVRIQRQAQRHQPRRGGRESVPFLFAQGRS